MFALRFLAAAATALAFCLAAGAQAPPSGPAARRAEEVKARAQRVVDLSQVMGSAHYLATLCGGRNEQTWRERMRRFLEVEGKGPKRTEMVEAFNTGYRLEQERFEDCTPAVESAQEELMVQGRRLSDGLAAPYRPQ